MSAGLWAGCTLLELIRRAGNRLLGTGTGTENNYGLGRISDRKIASPEWASASVLD